MAGSIDKIKPQAPVNILLPICIEMKDDVFLNIVRNIVNRARLDENSLYNALKSGMTTGTFTIDSEDILVNWKELTSKSKQVLQSKMLGFWAVQNFPSLGRKLFGDSWQAHQRQCIDVVGKKSMTPEEIDNVVFGKLKLRIIELSVTGSTIGMLKHFKIAPINIGKCNALQISPKMRSFNIEDEHLPLGWDVLKGVKFSSNNSMNVELPKVSRPAVLLSPLPHGNDEHTANLQSAKRQRLECSAENDVKDAFGDSSIESLRIVLLELRKDICKLTNKFDGNVRGHESQRVDATERLYAIIIKQKDELIAEMKLSAKELQNEIENLKNANLNINVQMESNISMMSALRKCVEANSELHEKLKADLAVSINLVDKYKQNIARQENTIRTLEYELRTAKDKMLDSELSNPILTENLADAKKMNIDLVQKNDKLEEELIIWKDSVAKKGKELEEVRKMVKIHADGNSQLRNELNNVNSSVAKMIPELQCQIQNLDTNLNKMKERNENLEVDLAVWKEYAAKKEKELEEVKIFVKLQSNDNKESCGQLSNVKSPVASLDSDMMKALVNVTTNLKEMTALAEEKKLTEANRSEELEDPNKLLGEMRSSPSVLSLPKALQIVDIMENPVMCSEVNCASLEMLENRNESQIDVACLNQPETSFVTENLIFIVVPNMVDCAALETRNESQMESACASDGDPKDNFETDDIIAQ